MITNTEEQCPCHRCLDDRIKNSDITGLGQGQTKQMKMMAEIGMLRMILCPSCGNKRCPQASDHRHSCTGSNEPGQPGSIYQ